MNRIVDIENIIETLFDEYGNTNTFNVTFEWDGANVDVLTTADFLNEIATNYYEMSYLTHKAKEQDVTEFVNMWNLYKLRHGDEWGKIFAVMQMEINPTWDYSEIKTITPNLTSTNTNTYGRTTTNSGGTSTLVSHGKNVTGQTSTYDGELRDSAKSAESGSTGTTTTDTQTSALGGTDSQTATTKGTTTEEKNGYKTNPYEQLEKYISFNVRFDLRDMIISGFTKECLFYDNGNGGDFNCLPLI